MRTAFLLLLITFLSPLYSQDIELDTFDIVQLVPVEIELPSGFNEEDFIRMIQNDTSLYKSFKNLWLFPHFTYADIYAYSNDDQEKASCKRKTYHHHRNDSTWIEYLEESTTGKFYNRKGEHRFYTTEMFDVVFFPKDTINYKTNQTSEKYEQNDWSNRQEKHYEQLKTFIFNPGTDIKGVPIIGKKLEIFSEDMRPLYNFKIGIEMYKGIQCYVFEVTPKKDTKPGDIVITHLKSYFDQETFSLMHRDYQIKHNTLLFDFDMRIIVNLDKQGDYYLPSNLSYSGWWRLPFKKPEIMKFNMIMRGYEFE